MAIVTAIDQLRFRVSAIGDAAVLIAVGSTLTWIADSDLDSQTRTMVEMLSASGLAREAVTCLPPAEEGDPLTNAGESMMSAPVALAAIPIRAYERTLVCSP